MLICGHLNTFPNTCWEYGICYYFVYGLKPFRDIGEGVEHAGL